MSSDVFAPYKAMRERLKEDGFKINAHSSMEVFEKLVTLKELNKAQTNNKTFEEREKERIEREEKRERAKRIKDYFYFSNLPYLVKELKPFVAKNGVVSQNQTITFNKIRVEWNKFLEAKNIIFYGGYGLGKTYLSVRIACNYIENDVSAKFIRSNEYVEKVTRFEDMSFFKDTSILILDEVGDQSVDNRYITHIRELLIHRDAKGLKTIMTTNRDIKELPAYLGGRVWDRVRGSLYLLDFGNGRSLRGM